MNNRDQLDTLWPDLFKAEDNVERPSEPLYRVDEGSNFGWPYCFHDFTQNKLVLNPEYGGDGKAVGRCTEFTAPIAVFPPHWAPVDLTFYTGTQFPQKYRGGAFIAFHGSWNRSPMPQDGYNVTFQPFAAGSRPASTRCSRTASPARQPLMRPNDAAYRADGVAQAPRRVALHLGQPEGPHLARPVSPALSLFRPRFFRSFFLGGKSAARFLEIFSQRRVRGVERYGALQF